MTVSYSPDDSFFVILFARWKGSIWKLIWKWFLAYFSLYYVLYFLYHYMFENREADREYFRALVWYVRGALPYYPLNFVLGFFVLGVVGRWWTQACIIMDKCKPDEFMRVLCSYLGNTDPRVFAIRRTLARWCCLLTTYTWRTLSTPILKRFPTEQHIIGAGLMTENEHAVITEYCEGKPLEKWIVPGIFCLDMLKNLHKEGLLDSVMLKHCIQNLYTYMDAYRRLYFNVWLCIPMVYTHVATIAAHVFFLVSMLGNQPVLKGDIDMYVPVMTVFQFLFYMGWLLVAQDLFDPFGEDDDDLEMNFIFDRNYKMAMDIADYGKEPDPADVLPSVVPHTRSSIDTNEVLMPGSLAGFSLSESEQTVVVSEDDQQEFLESIMPKSQLVKRAMWKRFSSEEPRQKTIRAI